MSAGQWLGIGFLSLIALGLLVGVFRVTRNRPVDPDDNKGTTTGNGIWYESNHGGGGGAD